MGNKIVLEFIFSLGLISDSFHMFFDCTGLLAGLAASVITKWRANDKYSYGYVRAEVIAGFVNGLFLLFIAFFIMSEAVSTFFLVGHFCCLIFPRRNFHVFFFRSVWNR